MFHMQKRSRNTLIIIITIAPGPLERTCWGQFEAHWGDWKNSWIAPFNVVITIIIIVIIVIIIIENKI